LVEFPFGAPAVALTCALAYFSALRLAQLDAYEQAS
jgi:hypothetical protein